MACFTGKKSFREYVCVKIAARGGGNPRTALPLAAHSRSGRTCFSVNVSLEKVQEIIILPYRLQKCANTCGAHKAKIFVTVVGLRKLQQLLSLAFSFFSRRDYFEIAFLAPLHPSSSEGHLGV